MSRILMLTSEFPPCKGGIATYCREVSRAAAALGHEITVVAPDFRAASDELNDSDYPFDVVRFPGAIYTYRDLPAMLRRCSRWLKQGPWDCVHAADWPHLMALAFLQKFRTVRFQATIYGTEVLSLKRAWQVKVLGVGRLFERAERLFPISEGTRDLLLEHWGGVKPERATVAPMGIDSRWFEPENTPVDIRERHGIAEDTCVILTVARLDERKGQDRVIEALGRIDSSLRPNVVYVVVGADIDAAYAKRVREMASRCPCRVIVAGAIPEAELKSYYRTADIFCMPGAPHETRIEGFGLAYLEAASQGVPSIAGRAGGVPEVVLDGETGGPGDIGGCRRNRRSDRASCR